MYKKILIITDNLQDQINGVVTTFKNLETMAVLDGYSIVYLTPREFVHFSCPGYPEVKLAWPWGIGKKIKEISPDYIHIATEGPLGVCARLYLDFCGYRYNTSYHTKFPEFLKKIYYIPEWITWGYLRWFHKHSGIVLTNTDTMVKELLDHGFKTTIKPWTRGVNRDELQPTQAWPHPNPRPLVLYVGRVSAEKNIEAVCELVDTYDVVIVGDGPYRKELEEKYTGCQFLGYKTGRELADWYSRADVLAFPSHVDTFGLVMIEAMSLGTPVAAYPVAGPKDIIEQGRSGFMGARLRDAVEICLHIPRKKVVESSDRWSWELCWVIFEENLVSVKKY
ncbi:RfaG Glycosyltransferase [uncultured Caudovirales phage]|uniref:RfaG Glycosyltransferase n=1 Tax=uncultured Caudovirales phage TaxID=2100421 RepID=A0A6J5LK73_9CAUD|nr:RfaG Glycosyltransferase [uncultured Caudovirales phage]